MKYQARRGLLINFPEILFELFKNNKHVISEGGIIREIMTRNGMNVPSYLSDKWLGLAFEFKDIRHLYDRLNISYANGNGTYLWDNGVKDYRAHLKFINDLSNKLNITDNESKSFLYANGKKAIEYNEFLNSNSSSSEAKLWVKGQIQLELLIKNIPWKSGQGLIANQKSLKYTHFHHDYGGGKSYFKLEDNSIVVSTSTEQKLSESGDLTDKYRDNIGVNFNDAYFYIKTLDNGWSELLINPSSTSDGLRELFDLGGIALGKSIGSYILPIEDIKILIDGKDFDGNRVARWKAAGGILLTIIPGGKIGKAGGKIFIIVDQITSNSKVFGAIYKAGNKVVTFGLKKAGEAATVLKNARRIAGKAVGNGVEITGKWLKGTHGSAGFFPKSIADKMRNKVYKNFDEFRNDFWKNVANDPSLAGQFSSSNVSRMKKGLAPKVHNSQQLGGQTSYVLHHKTPIHKGGGVYDVDNLFIVTPKYHKEILIPEYHYGYGY